MIAASLCNEIGQMSINSLVCMSNYGFLMECVVRITVRMAIIIALWYRSPAV